MVLARRLTSELASLTRQLMVELTYMLTMRLIFELAWMLNRKLLWELARRLAK